MRSKAEASPPPARTALLDCAGRIERDLRGNILPFWIEHVVTRDGRGFVGAMTNELAVDRAAERGMLLTARILWTYAAAFRRYGDAQARGMAELAYADLSGRFADPVYGGFRWSLRADGAVAASRKQIYGHAFAIYALAEYHAATNHAGALAQAIAIFELVETHARDWRHGGYLEAFAEDWGTIADVRLSPVDPNEPKSQNTHLHLLEAYTGLLGIWPDAKLQMALADLLECMLTSIVAPSGHLGLFFARDWASRSEGISYGHDIEASWLLTLAAEILGDRGLQERARLCSLRLAELTLEEGVDADGGVFNGGGPVGVVDPRKEWWPQAEAVVGFLNTYELSRDARFLRAALRTWDFIEMHLVDRRHGEWLRGVTREGSALEHELKVSFWKCPYHNGRAGLEAVRRLRAIAQNDSPS